MKLTKKCFFYKSVQEFMKQAPDATKLDDQFFGRLKQKFISKNAMECKLVYLNFNQSINFQLSGILHAT